MRMAYSVMQVPPAATGAFCPSMGTNPLAATGGLVHVEGNPGTEEITVSTPGMPPASWDPMTSGSANAPDVILPDLYLAEATNMGPFARAGAAHTMRSDNVLPVPAGQFSPVPIPAAPPSRRARIGGRKVWPMPRVVATWTKGT